jgi:FkbM family methyltransferase
MPSRAAIEDYDLAFRSLLGRALNDSERDAVVERFGNEFTREELVRLLIEIVASDEYFDKIREDCVRRLFPAPCVVAAKTPLGDEVLVDLRQFHLGFAIATGHFEPRETAFVRRHVRPGFRVLDIGANIGYFTTAFARLVGRSGSVHAFEPVGETYRKLQAAIRRNGMEDVVCAEQIALSDANGHVDMVFEKASTNIGAAHFASSGHEDQRLCFERVATKRLDDVIGRMPVDFVKIDVEGAEWLVIQGAHHVFRDQSPVVLMEFNAPQLQKVSGVSADFLLAKVMEFGFEPYEILDRGLVRKLPEARRHLEEALARTGITNLALAKHHLE